MRRVCVCGAMALLFACGLRAEVDPWEARYRNGLDLFRRGEYQQAWQVFRDMLREVDAGTVPPERRAPVIVSLGSMSHELGRDAEAAKLFARALKEIEGRRGRMNSDYAMQLNNLAALDLWAGRHRQAEPRIREAIAIYDAIGEPDTVRVAVARNALAEVLLNRGEFAGAEKLLFAARATLERTLGPHERTAVVINNLAVMRRRQGRKEEAVALFAEAAAMLAKVSGPRHPHTARALNNLAAAYADAGRFPQAGETYLQAIEITEATLGADHPVYGEVLSNYARLLRLQGRKAEAKPIESRARALLAGAARRNGDGMTVDVHDLQSFRPR